jgi:hypothetical protein
MSESTRRKIKQLRALAASTTFPEEAKSARAKADQLEATLGPQQSHAADAAAYHRGVSGFTFYSITPEQMRIIQEELIKRMDRDIWAAFGASIIDP